MPHDLPQVLPQSHTNVMPGVYSIEARNEVVLHGEANKLNRSGGDIDSLLRDNE
jgi:hypothetical protein